jgi:hypothetical protein
MQMNGQLHAMSSLPLGRSPRVPSGEDAKLGPQQSGRRGEKSISAPSPGIDFQFSDYPGRSLANT